MRSTSPLRALCSAGLAENILDIHPNEGADIGLMMTEYKVRTGDGREIVIRLVNDCPQESVVLSKRLWERLGRPDKVTLAYEEGRLSIDPA